MFENLYVLYANENYFDIVNACAKSIKTFSKIPVYVYLLNSDRLVPYADVTFNWECDIDIDESNRMYIKEGDNFYVNRSSKRIYRLIKERPLIVKDALNYSKNVCYIDCDSVVTPFIDRSFMLFNSGSSYPFATEGVYDFLIMNGKGGASSFDDLSTTLEHPVCELLGINQYNRKKYRTSNIFVAGQNCIDFLDEWYWSCINPKILAKPELYTPFQEETIMNVLLWKYNFQDGLPYVYTNTSLDKIDLIYNELGFTGETQMISQWFKLPKSKDELLAFHGEKRVDIMEQMIQKLMII